MSTPTTLSCRSQRVVARRIVFGLLCVSVLIAAPAFAEKPPVNQSSFQIGGTFQSHSGVAANGYDVVSYFEKSAQPGKPARPRKGSVRFTHVHAGALWLFANANNLAKFKKNPAAFAPQYGGYCTVAVANNLTAAINEPEVSWEVYKGKLYLNQNKLAHQVWRQDKDGTIEKANRFWPRVLKK